MSTGHIRERGPGSWEIRYELPRLADGRRRTRTLTIKGSKRDAQRELRQALAAVDAGTHVDRSKITVAQLLRESIEQWRRAGKISSRTCERYADDAKNYIVPSLGALEIQKLTTVDLERWHGELLSRLAPTTVRQAHRLLGQALARALKHGMVVRNVAVLEKAPAPGTREPEILQSEQIAPMLKALEGHPLHAEVVTSLYTGVRRGELLALCWGDIDLDGATLTVNKALEETRQHGVRVKEPKSERSRRRVSLPAIVAETLRAHRLKQLEQRAKTGARPRADLVFPGPGGGHWVPTHFSVEWRRTVRRLGLPVVTWHALRHGHASMLIAAGCDVVTVSKRLGHASADLTLRIYSHLWADGDRKAADAIDRIVGSL
jgi:integrase